MSYVPSYKVGPFIKLVYKYNLNACWHRQHPYYVYYILY